MDRISELMDGSYGGRRQRREARDRFDWMLARLPKGPVLDVGCSQGFLSFELAARGIASTGLDVDVDVIAYAKAQKADARDDIAALIHFDQVDFLTYDGPKFAHIVIGQVLEHVDDPATFLAKAKAHLAKGGHILVSVPYGRWDHDDHHHAFYLSDFREMIGKHWRAEDIELIGGRLCAVLKPASRKPGQPKTDWAALELKLFEAKEARHDETAADWRSRFEKADASARNFEAAYKSEKERRTAAEEQLTEFRSSKLFRVMNRIWQAKGLTRPGEIKRLQRRWRQSEHGRAETRALKAGHLSAALKARRAGVRAGADLNPDMLSAQLDLIRNGFTDPKANTDHAPYEGKAGRIAYVVHNSFPFSGAGYAVRTHGLVSALGRAGMDAHVISRLGYPHDRRLASGTIPEQEVIDGVTYARLIEETHGYGRIPQTQYLEAFTDRLEAHVRDTQPALLHAASNYMNGIAANAVAKRLGIPSVYEVRGLWELTRISRQPDWQGSEAWQLMVAMETQAAKEADRVLALTPALKDILIERGVEAERISVVSNAVDISKFDPEHDEPAWDRPADTAGKTVIGYIGSLLDYEGVDDLIAAFDRMPDNSNTVLLIVGNGAVEETLRDKAANARRGAEIFMVGRQPFAAIPNWYASCDLLVYPRKPLPVCEAVAPVKIFDAMAARKPVLASSVRVLSDIVTESGAGRTFEKGRVDALAQTLGEMCADPDSLAAFAQAGHEHVKTHSWARSADHVLDAYRALGVGPS